MIAYVLQLKQNPETKPSISVDNICHEILAVDDLV